MIHQSDYKSTDSLQIFVIQYLSFHIPQNLITLAVLLAVGINP